ncbi:MAG: hypothetical protein IJ343_15610 [Clostridia bacterium]|nr:hypothetical protein [Clostridia bacterium]
MKGFFRTIAALLALVLLMVTALAGLFCVSTSAAFLKLTGSDGLRASQQARIERAAAELTEKWGLAPELLTPWIANAAEQQSVAMTAWWHGLWNDPDAEASLPPYFDPAAEQKLVLEIRNDPGFQTIAELGQQRAIARDEVVYVLDEAICDTVTPLRRSILGLVMTTASEYLNLPQLRSYVLIGTAILAGAALVLLLLAHRAAGSTLLASALSMALVSVPVWLTDLCGMMAQLNPLAEEQARHLLICVGVYWYGVAFVLALAGLLLLALKGTMRRRGR